MVAITVALTGLVIAAIVAWLLLRSSPRAGTPAASETAEIKVRVRGTYDPDVIVARAGIPLLITFRREETTPGSERVVFSDLGLSAMLPPFKDVVVELRPERPGEHEFTCEMGLLRGRLVVLE